jgi:hypothetical protein
MTCAQDAAQAGVLGSLAASINFSGWLPYSGHKGLPIIRVHPDKS